MIIETSLCEPSIKSCNGHHYNDFGHEPFNVYVEWNGTMFSVIFGSFHVSTSHKNKLMCHTLKTFEI
jgi:hypothetical protein